MTAEDSVYLLPKYIEELTKIATANSNLVEIADLLFVHSNHSLPALSDHLSHSDDEKAVLLLRQITTLDWANEDKRIYGAYALIRLVYGDDAKQALNDELELVCFAAAKRLELQSDVNGLMQALQNGSARVRRIAAWYMGRNRVNEATSFLLKLVEIEKDGEVLRAAIWALGVLRTASARSPLQSLLFHPDTLIQITAQEALLKLV
jgi:HEAT repeat protein